MNGNTFVLYDDSLSSPISGASVFSATFRVKDSVSAGSTVSASVNGISATSAITDDDGNVIYEEISLGSASWSATIAAPLSSNANLASLTCGNATLYPSFSSGTTSYSCTVPFEVTWLDLHYSVADSGASAWVSGNSLSVGDNTVSIGVEAANGNVKYYNIYVTRQQDPNYKPSTNAKLSSLSPSTGRLSPAFSSDVTEYVIYLPFEAEEFSLSGVAADGKAKSVSNSSVKLKDGDNPVSVVCTAEDGATQVTYTVHVYRMPAFAGVLPQIIDPDTADYRAVDAALEKVPLDLSDYTEESVAALKAAIAGVVRNLKKEDQTKVDAMAKAIEVSLAALEEKPAPVILTPWQKVLAAGEEGITIPYLSGYTGPVPLKYVFLAGLILLALLVYVIGTLVGRHAGKKKALRAIAATDSNGNDDPGSSEPPAPDEPPEKDPGAPDSQEELPPAEDTPVKDASDEDIPVRGIPAEDVPAEGAAVETLPPEDPTPEDAPAEDAPVRDLPADEAVGKDVPAEDVPSDVPPVEEAVIEDVPAEDSPVKDLPVEETPAEDPPVSDLPAEALPAVEAPAEDMSAERAPTGENSPEDTPLFIPPEKGIPPVEADPISRITLDELLEDIRNM